MAVFFYEKILLDVFCTFLLEHSSISGETLFACLIFV